jgi:hypothetical protein
MTDYTVGRGKPPVASQFKPGQSGNPKGRPRKPQPAPVPIAIDDLSASYDEMLRRELGRTISARDARGCKQTLTVEAAVLRAQVQTALRGGVHAPA